MVNQIALASNTALLEVTSELIAEAASNIGFTKIEAKSQEEHIVITASNGEGQSIKSLVLTDESGVVLDRDTFGFEGVNCNEALDGMDKELQNMGWDISTKTKQYKDNVFLKKRKINRSPLKVKRQ